MSKQSTTRKIEQRFWIIRMITALAIALAIAFILIASVSGDPLATMHSFLIGPVTTVRRMGNVVGAVCNGIAAA